MHLAGEVQAWHFKLTETEAQTDRTINRLVLPNTVPVTHRHALTLHFTFVEVIAKRGSGGRGERVVLYELQKRHKKFHARSPSVFVEFEFTGVSQWTMVALVDIVMQ